MKLNCYRHQFCWGANASLNCQRHICQLQMKHFQITFWLLRSTPQPPPPTPTTSVSNSWQGVPTQLKCNITWSEKDNIRDSIGFTRWYQSMNWPDLNSSVVNSLQILNGICRQNMQNNAMCNFTWICAIFSHRDSFGGGGGGLSIYDYLFIFFSLVIFALRLLSDSNWFAAEIHNFMPISANCQREVFHCQHGGQKTKHPAVTQFPSNRHNSNVLISSSLHFWLLTLARLYWTQRHHRPNRYSSANCNGHAKYWLVHLLQAKNCFLPPSPPPPSATAAREHNSLKLIHSCWKKKYTNNVGPPTPSYLSMIVDIFICSGHPWFT